MTERVHVSNAFVRVVCRAVHSFQRAALCARNAEKKSLTLFQEMYCTEPPGAAAPCGLARVKMRLLKGDVFLWLLEIHPILHMFPTYIDVNLTVFMAKRGSPLDDVASVTIVVTTWNFGSISVTVTKATYTNVARTPEEAAGFAHTVQRQPGTYYINSSLNPAQKSV